MVTARATTRGTTSRTLAVGGALAVLAAGALTMTDRAMAVAPPAVPVCAAPTLQSFTNGTDQDISATGTPTVTSTINVTGAPSSIRDIDLLTNIAHTHSGDLRITLSHLGRTVLIKAPSNGLGNVPGGVDAWNDVFAGTLWDDSAGVVSTDREYTADGAVSPLVPEGSLAAFNGMNPNGAWTLTVQDTVDLDGGTLRDWSLAITGANDTPPATQTNVTGTGGDIDDNATLTRTVNVSGAKAYLLDVNLRTAIQHTANGDLDIRLSHGGKTVKISTNNGFGEDNLFNGTLWDDSAATAVTVADVDSGTIQTVSPEEALSPFIGMNPNGVWTLTIADQATVDEGSLANWSLEIQSTDGCVTPPDSNPNPPAPGDGTTTTPIPVPLPPGPIAKLKPSSVGLKVSGRDRKAPYVITASGKVSAPAAAAAGCVGKVRVQVKAGKKTVTTKTVTLTKACTYKARFTLKKLPKSLPKSGKVTVSARFLGNVGLQARASKAGSVRLG